MTIRQSLLVQAVLGIAASIYSAVIAHSLPDRVPIHWGLSGKPDGWGSPALSLWFGPGMIAFMMLMTWGLPKISPQKFTIDRFEAAYGTIMVMVAALMGVLHVVILRATAGQAVDMNLWIMLTLGIFFAVMGNMMGKVRRNFFMGIRTPWTLASEPVWDATHRRAARLWFFGGLAIAILAAIGTPIWISATLLTVLGLWPVALSYILYRKLENH